MRLTTGQVGRNQDLSQNLILPFYINRLRGGGGGIRTHETISRLAVFKTAAFNHSATPPDHPVCVGEAVL